MKYQSWRLLLVVFITPFLSACGSSSGGANFTLGGSGQSNQTTLVSLGISDARVFSVKEVVITVDSITLRRSGDDDIIIDEFTSAELGIVEEDSFQIDLLAYQGSNQAIVVEDMELPSGEYTDMILAIQDDDLNASYVLELDDTQTPINVPSGDLRLGSFTLNDNGEQTFTIEFDLGRSMAYRPGPNSGQDVYNLKPRGVRLQDNSDDQELSGSVDDTLFNSVSPCDEKEDPTIGNVLYLYQGHNLAQLDLADAFDPDDSETDIPEGAIEPFAVSPVIVGDEEGSYEFAFLPAGEYTLVYSCNAHQDDADNYDGLDLPLPEDQLIELNLTTGSGIRCNLPIENAECS